MRWKVAPRSPRITAGYRSKSRWWNGRYSVSGLGTTYGAERWNTVSEADPVDDRRHELDRARPGADHRDAGALERHVVAPLGGVERRPRERPEARQLRDHRVGELADRRDHHVRLVGGAVGGPHPPLGRLVVVRRLAHLLPGAHQVEQAGLTRGALEVGEDLGLPGVAVAPRRVERPRPGVERRRDVAGRAGVGVVAPDAADGVRALEHHDVLDALPAQRVRRAEPAEAGADDQAAGSAHVHAP